MNDWIEDGVGKAFVSWASECSKNAFVPACLWHCLHCCFGPFWNLTMRRIWSHPILTEITKLSKSSIENLLHSLVQRVRFRLRNDEIVWRTENFYLSRPFDVCCPSKVSNDFMIARLNNIVIESWHACHNKFHNANHERAPISSGCLLWKSISGHTSSVRQA